MEILKVCLTIIILAIVLTTTSIQAEILRCHFRTAVFTISPPLYTCFVQNNKLFKHSRAHIDVIDGQHEANMTNEDVQGLSILSIYNMKFVPNNIENFFTNIILLQIWNTDYEEIHQQDLKGFTKLKYLQMSNNQLKAIEGDLFSSNGDLEFVWLHFNKISRIDPFAFSHLNKLWNLKLFGNDCVNSDKVTRTEVIELVRRIEGGECSENETVTRTVQSKFYEIEQELIVMRRENENLKIENEEMSENLTNLIDEMKKMKFMNEEIISESKMMRDELQEAKNELKSTKRQNLELASINELSIAAVQRLSADNDELRQKNEKLERITEKLKKNVATLTKSFQILQANHGTLIRRMRERITSNDENIEMFNDFPNVDDELLQ